MKFIDFIDNSHVLDVLGRTVCIIDECGTHIDLLSISDDEYMGDLTVKLLDSLFDAVYQSGLENGSSVGVIID